MTADTPDATAQDIAGRRETPEERADRICRYMHEQSAYYAQIAAQNVRLIRRIQKQRRIITRLLSMRHGLRAILAAEPAPATVAPKPEP